MSGNIFGICTLARGLGKATTDKPLASIDSVLPSDREQQVANLGDLMDGHNKLIDQIYEVRASIDSRNT